MIFSGARVRGALQEISRGDRLGQRRQLLLDRENRWSSILSAYSAASSALSSVASRNGSSGMPS